MGSASDELVDDGVEGVEAGLARRARRASRRRRGSRRRRRSGRARSAGARRSRRRHRTRPGASRRRARPDRHDLEVVRSSQARVAGDDPRGEVGGGARTAGRASRGGATRRGTGRMPSSGPKSADRRLDEPAEQRDPEAEVRRPRPRPRRGRAAAPRRASRSAAQPVVAMTNRRQPASSAAVMLAATASPRDASTTSVGAARGRPGRGRPRRRGRPQRPRSSPGSASAVARGRLDRAAERAVAEDEHRVHVVGPFHRCGGAAGSEVQGHEKAAVTVVVPRPLEPPFPGGPGSSCRTRRQSPRARASRQGRQSFFLDSSEKVRRFMQQTIRITADDANISAGPFASAARW